MYSIYRLVFRVGFTLNLPLFRSVILRDVTGTYFHATLRSRYIRCVKPNPDKEKDRLDAFEVLRQLQYSGMMETIRIRRQV